MEHEGFEGLSLFLCSPMLFLRRAIFALLVGVGIPALFYGVQLEHQLAAKVCP
jgi:hypothetical protein